MNFDTAQFLLERIYADKLRSIIQSGVALPQIEYQIRLLQVVFEAEIRLLAERLDAWEAGEYLGNVS